MAPGDDSGGAGEGSAAERIPAASEKTMRQWKAADAAGGCGFIQYLTPIRRLFRLHHGQHECGRIKILGSHGFDLLQGHSFILRVLKVDPFEAKAVKLIKHNGHGSPHYLLYL